MTDDPALCRRISGIPVLIAESSFVCIEETSLTFPKMLAALMPLINFERLIEDFNQPGSGQSLRSEYVWLYHGILPLRTLWNAREYGDDAASIVSVIDSDVIYGM